MSGLSLNADAPRVHSAEAPTSSVPENAAAAAQAVASKYRDKEFDAAEALATSAVRLHPDSFEVSLEHAMVPMHGPDKALAAKQFCAVRNRFPDRAPVYGYEAMALRQLGRIEEAEALLADAIVRFPDDASIFIEYALCACERRAGDEAVRRCQMARDRFPGRAEGWWLLSNELMRAGRLEEAEAVIAEAVMRYPNSRFVLWQWAKTATEKQDWPEAERRWRVAKTRHPDWPQIDIGMRLMRTAAYPDDKAACIGEARSATATGPREEALRLWEEVRRRFPEMPDGHWMLSNELVRAGRLAEAEAVIVEGAKRFPDHDLMLWQWARTATQRHDWAEAARRWEVAKSRFPEWPQINEGMAEMRLAMGLLRLADPEAPPIHGGAVPIPAVAIAGAPSELLMRFESLGDNCEFGIVQRLAGIEPLGLLRWANNNPSKLLALLTSRFEGVGEARNTRLWVNPYGEYGLIDERYFGMHTFINVGGTTADELLPKMLRRLRFLKDKLIEDLTNGEKIFVYKSVHVPLDLDQMRTLAAAIRAYGKSTLFCVQKPPTPEKDNTVEQIEDGLLAGYMSRLTIDPQAAREYVSDWFAISRLAAELAAA